MIRSFRNAETEKIWNGSGSRRFPADIQSRALDRLEMLNAAETLNDLRAVPGNRFEALKGDRSGQYSIRINRQWRICFDWIDNNAENVEIVDYH